MSLARPVRLLALVLGVGCAALGIVALTLGAAPEIQVTHQYAAMAAAFIPYGVAAWAIAATVSFALARGWWRRLLVPPLLVGLAVQVTWTVPYWPHPPEVAVGDELTVMTLNLYYGRVRLDQLTARITQDRPDILVVQEVTSANARVLSGSPWRELLPHRIGQPHPTWLASHMMVLSRHPLERIVASSVDAPVHVVRVDLPSGSVTVVAVHATNPTVDLDAWRSDLADVSRAVRSTQDLPTLVLGDFNAVREHLPLQQILSGGFRDAAELAGNGWLPTYPTGGLGPLIGIDHVLVDQRLTAAAVWTWPIDGTDHRGLSARLRRR